MNNPLVSIIIPTYNRANLLGETLNSILSQTYENWECIIVDDGSTDDTFEVVEKFLKTDSRFQFYHRPTNRPKGANTCRNYGFELSKGEFVNWFDSDDLMLEDKLSIQVESLYKSDFNFSVCQTLIFEGNVLNVLGVRHEKIYSETPLLDFIKHDISFLTQAPFFRVKFLKDIGLKFDEDLQAAQEWEFICKVLYYSPTYHVDNNPLVLIRKHDNSITYSNNLDYREWNYYLARKKIFYFLKNADSFSSKGDILRYLKRYFKDYLKEILFKKQADKSMYVFFKTIAPFESFRNNIKIFLIVMMALLAGRGYKYKDLI